MKKKTLRSVLELPWQKKRSAKNTRARNRSLNAGIDRAVREALREEKP